jgi:hypothetical protein
MFWDSNTEGEFVQEQINGITQGERLMLLSQNGFGEGGLQPIPHPWWFLRSEPSFF